MFAQIQERVEIPEEVKIKLEGGLVEVQGPKGKLTRRFNFPGVKLSLKDGQVLITALGQKRRHKASVGTIKSHLKNMVKGVREGFKYKLRVVYAHFPITVKVEGRRVLIQNFLGEKTARVAKVAGDVEVKVQGDEVIVEGIDKEHVGQTAVNIEQATKIKRRDPRVFQDGIYLVEKA